MPDDKRDLECVAVNICFAATLVKDRQATGMRGDQLDDADGTEETSNVVRKGDAPHSF